MAQLPSAAQALDHIDGLKNWGPWGPDDQRGTLNLTRPEHRVAAAQLVTEGRTVSCARDLVTAARYCSWRPMKPVTSLASHCLSTREPC
jgi:hypothetical protein